MTRVDLEREMLLAAMEILASRADPDAINAAVARHAAAIERMIRDHYGVREHARTSDEGGMGKWKEDRVTCRMTDAGRKARVIADDSAIPTLCDDCPPVGYPTDKTRCLPCPRRVLVDAQRN